MKIHKKRLLFLLLGYGIAAFFVHPIFAKFFWPTVGKCLEYFFLSGGWASQMLDTPSNVLLLFGAFALSMAIEATLIVFFGTLVYWYSFAERFNLKSTTPNP